MTIEGLQKLTLLDYPGKTACTVFLGGCNYRCPFCHNYELAAGPLEPLMEEEALLSFLKKRQGLLDGVCVTGGEPLLREELPAFIRKVKALGYLVKVDTNGTFPDRLKALAAEGLLDYVAMDIKNAPARYRSTAGVENPLLERVRESVAFLLSGPVDYEFRTTVIKGLHRLEDMAEISRWIQGARRYFLQQFRVSDQVPDPALEAYAPGEMRQLLQVVQKAVPSAQLRGIE